MANKPRPDTPPRRPSTTAPSDADDQSVHGTDTPPTKPREATRRLTLDIPTSLHFAMKMRAAATGITMVEEVTPLLMNHYADDLKRYHH
jgi:hypothetical protein